jgi:hypothetical protein
MPCYDGREHEENRQNALLVKEQKAKIDELTNMLCLTCSKLTPQQIDPKVYKWYMQHLDKDKVRVVNLFNELLENNQLKGSDLRAIEEILDKI